MSRECGELRMRLERSEAELQKVTNSTKQESGRVRSLLADIWKVLDVLGTSDTGESSRVGPKGQNESISSELSRLQGRLSQLSESAGGRQRLKELESTVSGQEAEMLQMSRNFSVKLIDLNSKMESLVNENDALKRKAISHEFGSSTHKWGSGFLPPLSSTSPPPAKQN